jgi:metallo-beta-lactamase class B
MTFAMTAIALLAQLIADPPNNCDPCAEWNQPQAPFRVHGDTWYVGTAGLGAILLTSKKGHILIDGGLPQSAPLIAANIAQLGFRLEDVKVILNSHTHYDHAGGIAVLQRASGAKVMASPESKKALERGGPTSDDPQFGFGKSHNDYSPVANVRAVKDGETVRVGPLAITAHFTPGHTPGGTTWTWRSCEGERCFNVVYVDSLNSISAPGFKFTEGGRVAAFERAIAVVDGLPCDLLLAPHPSFIDMPAKLAAWKAKPDENPFVGTGACHAFAQGAGERLKARVAEEQAPPPAAK